MLNFPNATPPTTGPSAGPCHKTSILCSQNVEVEVGWAGYIYLYGSYVVFCLPFWALGLSVAPHSTVQSYILAQQVHLP